MVFFKLVHKESQVNHKTQPFWVEVVHLVPNLQILAGHAIGTIHLAPKSIHLRCGNVAPDGADWHYIATSQMNGFIEKSY